MRRILALVIGTGFAVGGLLLLYNLFFEAVKIPFMFVAGGGFMTFIGAAVMWDTVRNWNIPQSSDD